MSDKKKKLAKASKKADLKIAKKEKKERKFWKEAHVVLDEVILRWMGELNVSPADLQNRPILELSTYITNKTKK
jgi:hypothetical protein